VNCDDFRHRLLIDPLSPDPAMRAHRDACKACAAEAQRAAELEAQLRIALADEVDAGHLAVQRAPRPVATRILLGLGFGLLLIAIGWWAVQSQPRDDAATPQLAELAVAHVRAEIGLLDGPRAQNVSGAEAKRLLQSLGAGEDVGSMAEMPRLRYAGRCTIAASNGAHLVLDGERGPVTALFMPERRIAAPSRLEDDRFEALLVPTAHGALALIGEAREPLADMAERITGAR
jgi:hypothetical protein